MDPATRRELAHRALVPGGVLALFGHEYTFADPHVEAAVNAAYARHAPELLHDPDRWMQAELAGTPLFTDVTTREYETVVPYPTAAYLSLPVSE